MDPASLKLNVPDILGPWILGNMFASALCGGNLVQTAHYFYRFPGDRLYYKLTVTGLVLLSVAGWVIQQYDMWWFSITSRGPDANLIGVPLLIYIPFGMGSTFSQLISQSFFAYRSYSLCDRNRWIGGAFALLIFLSFGLTFTAAVLVLIHPKFLLSISLLKYLKMSVPGIVFGFDWVPAMHEADMCVSAFTDILITIVLTWKMAGERQGFRESTDNLITRLIHLSISTAAVTSTFEITTAIVMLASIRTHNYTYFFGNQCPHIYALVTITSLNMRANLNPAHPSHSNPSKSGGTSAYRGTSYAASRVPTRTGEISSVGGITSMGHGARADPFPLSPMSTTFPIGSQDDEKRELKGYAAPFPSTTMMHRDYHDADDRSDKFPGMAR